jgi:hypothetical protein
MVGRVPIDSRPSPPRSQNTSGQGAGSNGPKAIQRSAYRSYSIEPGIFPERTKPIWATAQIHSG